MRKAPWVAATAPTPSPIDRRIEDEEPQHYIAPTDEGQRAGREGPVVTGWEEALMADATGANGGPRTLKEAIRKPKTFTAYSRPRYCGVCGEAIGLDQHCTFCATTAERSTAPSTKPHKKEAAA